MNKIFISHCTEDNSIGKHFIAFLNAVGITNDITLSSNPANGLGSGTLDNNLKDRINLSDTFILLVTKNYLRSYYCLAEISCAWYLGKTIIPIMFDTSAETKSIIDALTNRAITVDANNLSTRADDLVSKLFSDSPDTDTSDIRRHAAEVFFENATPSDHLRAYINSSSDYNNLLSPCYDYGIKAIKNGGIPEAELNNLPPCKEIYILATTGANLMKNLCANILPTQLKAGCKIKILIPNAMSEFCKDVSLIEVFDPINEFNIDSSFNFQRITKEFEETIYYAKESIQKAGKDCTGTITVACSRTLLRQTVTMFIYNDERTEGTGFMSLTLPPSRTVNGSLGIMFSSCKNNYSLFETTKTHLDRIFEIAEHYKETIDINALNNNQVPSFFKLEQLSAKNYWKDLNDKAQYNMNKAFRKPNGLLLEVAAQHPLVNDEPGEEFKARLDYAINIYHEAVKRGEKITIYVPGSIHRNDNEICNTSLSSAGVSYLISNGVDKSVLHGDDWNLEFKKDEGVYNSADECYVTSKAFSKYNYSRLACICSPIQAMRKYLFYIFNGVFPQMFCTSTEDMFHNVTDELFNSINAVIYKDHDWQSKDSEFFINSRKERRVE